MSFVSPKSLAAFGVGMRTVATARAGGAIAAVAKNAQAEIHLGRQAAGMLLQKSKAPLSGAAPPNTPARTAQTAKQFPAAHALVRRAVTLRANIAKSGPALAKKVVLSAKVKSSIFAIAQKARAGNPDALLAASVIARSAQALDHVARLQQAHAGGVAGLLLTADGRILRAPRGHFLQKTSAVSRPDTLYRGPKNPALKGSFSAVAGSKMMPERLDRSLEKLKKARARRLPAYQPGITTLKKQLRDCGEAFDELWTDYGAATGVHPPRYDDPSVIDADWAVGATPGWGAVAGGSSHHPARFGQARARYSRYGFDSSSLGVGDQIQFSVGVGRRSGVIVAINGQDYVVRSKKFYRSPLENLLVHRDQVIARRVESSVGASPGWGGALDPGQEIDGPLYDVRYSGSPLDDAVRLEDDLVESDLLEDDAQPAKAGAFTP
jgi:hypothetical protein